MLKFTFLLLLSLSCILYSQNIPVLKDSTDYILEPITITGTRSSTLLKNLPLTISIIGVNQIERSSSVNVHQLISQTVPSAFVLQRGLLGFGVATESGNMSIRGLGGSPTTGILFLIDGRPDIMGIFGHPLPDAYQLDNVSKVEIIRGPASFLYGTNAMAGVVNIITNKKLTDGYNLLLTGEYGSFNTQKYKINFGWKRKEFDIFATGSIHYTDGYRPESKVSSQSSSLRFGYKANNYLDLVIRGNITRIKAYNPGPINNPYKNNFTDITRGGTDLTFSYLRNKWNGSLILHGNFGKHKVNDTPANNPADSLAFTSSDRTLGTILYINCREIKNNLTTFGLDYKNFGGKPNSPTNFFPHEFVQKSQFGSYLNTKHTIGILSFNGGISYQYDSKYGSVVLPSAGFALNPLPQSTLKIIYSEGFRTPTLAETDLYPWKNPDLKPENLYSLEAGLEQKLFGLLWFELKYYYNDYKEMIVKTGSYPNFKLLNTGRVVNRGYEFSANLLWKSFLLNTSASYGFYGKKIAGIPAGKITAGADYTYKSFTLSFTLEHITELFGQDSQSSPLVRLPNFTLIGAKLSYEFPKYVKVSLSADNVINKTYEIIKNYPMPGRTYYAGVTFKL